MNSLPAAPEWLTKPSLEMAIIERIRAGVSLEEAKEYYRFMREIELDQARAAFTTALAASQQEMTTISRDMDNEQTRSSYASLGAVDRAIRPIYSKHGLAINFDTKPSEKGELWIKVVCEVGLGSYSITRSIDLLADGIGPKGSPVMTRTHATGSALTYGRRQLLKMVFNLAETDIDGNVVVADVSHEQVLELDRLIKLTGRSEDLFCKKFQIETIGRLPADKYAQAEAFLKQFIPADATAKS